MISFNKLFSCSSVTWLETLLVESRELLEVTTLDLTLLLLLLEEEFFLCLSCLVLIGGKKLDKRSRLARYEELFFRRSSLIAFRNSCSCSRVSFSKRSFSLDLKSSL